MEQEELVREHHVFWLLVKTSRDGAVGRVYLAVQAALAFGVERVDAGWLMGETMARGRRTTGPAHEPIGAAGLAYFSWLYEVELVGAGEEDVHEYRFRRRHDGKEIVVVLRTAANPQGLHYQQVYERERRALTEKREKFLAAARGFQTPGRDASPKGP